MKTKNIFKTLAFAILVPALLLNTACNSEIINNENTDGKGFALPVTVNVTRQGDDATKATYNESTGKLSFSEGDKLFVKGVSEAAGIYAGTLDYVAESGGTFSGIIYTSEVYSGTAAVLLGGAATHTATLLPAGYEGYGFLKVSGEGYSAKLATDYTKAFATSKAAAVEQFSLEQTSQYSDVFALAPQNAILNFTINGLAAKTEVAVSFTNTTPDPDEVINKNVTTDGSGNATFGIGVANSTSFHNCSLTVGGNPITLATGNKELTAGKIYNVTRSVAPVGHALSSAVVGDIICTDGLAYKGYDYNYLPTGVTAVAKVCYIGDGHGLALALEDEPNKMDWNSAVTACQGKTPTVTGCTWNFANEEKMNYMINSAGSYAALRDGFSFVGGTNMKAEGYWVYNTKPDQLYYARSYDFLYYSVGWDDKDHQKNVRACLTW